MSNNEEGLIIEVPSITYKCCYCGTVYQSKSEALECARFGALVHRPDYRSWMWYKFKYDCLDPEWYFVYNFQKYESSESCRYSELRFYYDNASYITLGGDFQLVDSCGIRSGYTEHGLIPTNFLVSMVTRDVFDDMQYVYDRVLTELTDEFSRIDKDDLVDRYIRCLKLYLYELSRRLRYER